MDTTLFTVLLMLAKAANTEANSTMENKAVQLPDKAICGPSPAMVNEHGEPKAQYEGGHHCEMPSLEDALSAKSLSCIEVYEADHGHYLVYDFNAI